MLYERIAVEANSLAYEPDENYDGCVSCALEDELKPKEICEGNFKDKEEAQKFNR